MGTLGAVQLSPQVFDCPLHLLDDLHWGPSQRGGRGAHGSRSWGGWGELWWLVSVRGSQWLVYCRVSSIHYDLGRIRGSPTTHAARWLRLVSESNMWKRSYGLRFHGLAGIGAALMPPPPDQGVTPRATAPPIPLSMPCPVKPTIRASSVPLLFFGQMASSRWCPF
jgi:hypothetical protein